MIKFLLAGLGVLASITTWTALVFIGANEGWAMMTFKGMQMLKPWQSL